MVSVKLLLIDTTDGSMSEPIPERFRKDTTVSSGEYTFNITYSNNPGDLTPTMISNYDCFIIHEFALEAPPGTSASKLHYALDNIHSALALGDARDQARYNNTIIVSNGVAMEEVQVIANGLTILELESFEDENVFAQMADIITRRNEGMSAERLPETDGGRPSETDGGGAPPPEKTKWYVRISNGDNVATTNCFQYTDSQTFVRCNVGEMLVFTDAPDSHYTIGAFKGIIHG